MPLPPYIHEKLDEKDRYQTVYAKNIGSSAAPTAGLHFTESLLEKIEKKGIILTHDLTTTKPSSFFSMTSAKSKLCPKIILVPTRSLLKGRDKILSNEQGNCGHFKSGQKRKKKNYCCRNHYHKNFRNDYKKIPNFSGM